MLEDLNDELADLRQRLNEQDRLRRRLDRAQLDLELERSRLSELEGRLDAEAHDVEKLEGLSLAALFHAVLGGRQQQLDQERRELLAARLARDECRASVDAMERDVARLSGELEEVGDARARYEAALAEKEREIADGGGLGAGRIFEMTEELADLRSAVSEIREAIEAGTSALDGLRGVRSSLDSARGWGTWDTLGRGGLLTNVAKHGHIDTARDRASEAQHRLRLFQRELSDVTGYFPAGFTIELESVSAFIDYFFDGLIVDWMAQSRINRSRRSVETVAERVQNTVAELEQRLAELQGRADRLDEERRDAIERA